MSGGPALAFGCANRRGRIARHIRLVASGQGRVSRKRRADLKSNARKNEMLAASRFNRLDEVRVIPCVHRHSVNNWILVCIQYSEEFWERRSPENIFGCGRRDRWYSENSCRLGETDHVVFQFADRDITDSSQQ